MEPKQVFKGRANVVIYDNNDVDVRVPQENPELRHERISETKQGNLSRTPTGCYVMHLRTPSPTCADPSAALRDEFDRLVRQFDKGKPTQLKLPNRGRWLMNEGDVKIRADSQTATVSIMVSIPLGTATECQQEFFTKVNEVSKCLVMQRALLSRLATAQKKSSSESSPTETED